MENLPIGTEFSKDEMKKLLLMVGIGELVLNGFRDEPLKEFESIEQKFYRFAAERGLGDCFDHGDGERLPNKMFEDSILKYINEYEDNFFWDELEDRLTLRDMIQKYGLDELRKMPPVEMFDKRQEFEKKYEAEFSTNGLDNVIVEPVGTVESGTIKPNVKAFDIRSSEKVNSDLSRLLMGQNFKSKEEMKSFINGIIGKPIPDEPAQTDLRRAQDIVYDAWDVGSRKGRIKMARQALAISADCADAYNILADEDAKTLEERRDLYKKGIEAGTRALGDEFFKDMAGHFWGHVPARPYMRSRAGFMEALWELGGHDDAIIEAKEILALNTGDNQGIRYLYITYLAELGLYKELEDFMDNGGYFDDCGAEWIYTLALLSFVKHGVSKESSKCLKTALERNKYVLAYLIGIKSIPLELPDRITMGGEDEAYCYADRGRAGWKKVPGAIEWLKAQAGLMTAPKTGRNDPCPCGSGKKHKKCCGC